VTPVPLELPLRPRDAAELANLIFDHAEGKPLTEETRTRLAGRASVLKLDTIKPYFGSLERDPVHPSAYYLAVDGTATDGTVAGQLLYLALANAPTSSIYYKPLLIGRMRRLNGPECVINTTPFGAADRDNVEMFAARINTAFYPQPQGARTTITVEEDYAAAFALFRGIQRRTGKNFAAFTGDCHAAMWSAIRAGWRQGYTVATDVEPGRTAEGMRSAAGFSRYSCTIGAGETGRKAAEEIHEQIRQARAAVKKGSGFDFEVCSQDGLSPDALRGLVEGLKEGAHTPQLVDAGAVNEARLAELAQVARQLQVTLSFRYGGESGAEVEAIGRATAGRVNYRVQSVGQAEMVTECLL
jgi:hypothetical protein